MLIYDAMNNILENFELICSLFRSIVRKVSNPVQFVTAFICAIGFFQWTSLVLLRNSLLFIQIEVISAAFINILRGEFFIQSLCEMILGISISRSSNQPQNKYQVSCFKRKRLNVQQYENQSFFDGWQKKVNICEQGIEIESSWNNQLDCDGNWYSCFCLNFIWTQ